MLKLLFTIIPVLLNFVGVFFKIMIREHRENGYFNKISYWFLKFHSDGI